MATILEFRASARGASSANPAKGQGVPAEIVLFPGVRYERWTETASRKRSKSKRRRDQIEIND